MAEIESNNLDEQNEGIPISGPADPHGGLDETHEGKPVVGYIIPDIFTKSVGIDAILNNPVRSARSITIIA